jgi:hypothetical protein
LAGLIASQTDNRMAGLGDKLGAMAKGLDEMFTKKE